MKMTVSKRVRWAAALAAATVVLAGCGSGGADGGSTKTGATRAPGQKIALNFWSWVPGVDKSVALWNKEHPDVQVKLEKVPAGNAGGYAKMFAALKAGKGAPDLAQVEYQVIPSFLLEKGLVNLADYGAKEGQSKFIDWQWKQGAVNGGVYAIPQASGPMAFFYRKDLFKKWGIAPPKTWADFRTAAKTIRAKAPKSYISTFPPGNAAWFTSLAWQAGAHWYGVDGNKWKVNMTDPNTTKVANYWDSLVKDKLVKTEPDFANGWYKDLQTGGVVGWIGAQWGDAIISGNAPKTAGKWAVAPIPQWNAGGEFRSANWGGSSTAVLTGTKYVKDAKDFAVWLNTNPKSVSLLANGGYGWPASKDGLKNPTLNRPYPFFGGQRINDVFSKADQSIDLNWAWTPVTDAAFQHLNDGFQASITGKGTFVDAVKKAQQQTLTDLKAKGLEVQAGG